MKQIAAALFLASMAAHAASDATVSEAEKRALCEAKISKEHPNRGGAVKKGYVDLCVRHGKVVRRAGGLAIETRWRHE